MFKKAVKRLQVPRYVVIIAKRLNMNFQPNRGSSFYKRPYKKRIPDYQKNWNSPVGTLRLSDHWGYENSKAESVYRTDAYIPKGQWALCINAKEPISSSWKVLFIFETKKSNVIREVDFKKVEEEIKQSLC